MNSHALASPSRRPRFAQAPRLLIVGCGDVGLRVLRELRGHWRVLALSSSPHRLQELRAAGALPLLGNLDDAATLNRLAGLADAVLHLAPPAAHGAVDERTRALLAALSRRGAPKRLVYASTSGVYGDCSGEWVPETRPLNAQTDRARRRVDAEARVRQWGRQMGVSVTVLRVPGIYALDRVGGDPRERLRRGTPVLEAQDDVFTNHIHADDLARACALALHRAAPQRIFNINDDAQTLMGDHFTQAAAHFGLKAPTRLPREQLRPGAGEHSVSPMSWSFMSESRRLDNHRMKHELRLRLRYPEPQLAWGEAVAGMPR